MYPFEMKAVVAKRMNDGDSKRKKTEKGAGDFFFFFGGKIERKRQPTTDNNQELNVHRERLCFNHVKEQRRTEDRNRGWTRGNKVRRRSK